MNEDDKFEMSENGKKEGNQETPSEKSIKPPLKTGFILLIAFYVIYGITYWDRLLSHSGDNHYVYQADAFLHGQLHLTKPPPHGNDWVRFNNKWYVSFPPLPAILMMPGVKIWGYNFNDRLFTFAFSAIPILFLFLTLEYLRGQGRISTTRRENIGLCILFGAGTVYYFVAVQGTVWFTAQVLGATFASAYMFYSLDARRPFIAGVCLGLGFLCRTPLLFSFPLFLYELLKNEKNLNGIKDWVGSFFKWKNLKKILLFAIFPAVVLIFAMVINYLRFQDPFEFGHRHLNVLWTSKFSKWGLFNYHFLSKNLACIFTLLPWLSRIPPYITISNHGLALWFTTPVLLYLLWPKKTGGLHRALWITVLFTAVWSLFYQNTGWVQFGYRFAVDYLLFLVVLIAVGGRKLTKVFWTLVVFGIGVNLFGAVTFGRAPQFYSKDQTQLEFFQPD